MTKIRPFFLLAGIVALGCSSDSTPVPNVASTGTKAAPALKAKSASSDAVAVRLQEEPFGETKEKVPITQYILSNDAGMIVSIINYGASVTSIEVPDRHGKVANVTLSFPTLEGYLGKQPYYGPICGRYANRIAKGKFALGERNINWRSTIPRTTSTAGSNRSARRSGMRSRHRLLLTKNRRGSN